MRDQHVPDNDQRIIMAAVAVFICGVSSDVDA
jgi:hypothetical protein